MIKKVGIRMTGLAKHQSLHHKIPMLSMRRSQPKKKVSMMELVRLDMDIRSMRLGSIGGKTSRILGTLKTGAVGISISLLMTMVHLTNLSKTRQGSYS